MSNSYCFKLIPNKNVMGHTYTCLEDDINLKAWQNISSATFFDIKIVPRFDIDVYKPILTKIKEIIKEKGFENAAASLSTSSTANQGGKIGWIDEDSLN